MVGRIGWLACVVLLGCVDDPALCRCAADAFAPGDALPADAAPPDAAPPDAAPPDAAPPDAGSLCPASCARVVECALASCDALQPADGPALARLCEQRCAELPAVGPVVAGLAACDEIVAFTEQAIPGIVDPCVFDPAFPPAEPLCALYGERLAECLGPVCAPAVEHRAALSAGFTHECDVAVAAGADPSAVQAIADAPCDAWADAARQRAEGDLAAFCARGPLDDPAACRAACAVASECLDPDAEANQPFRNPERCQMLCVASTDAPRGWACLAERMTCETIEPCFARGPEPACRAEAARVVECVGAVCAPVEPLTEGLRSLLIASCDAAVADRSRAPAEVEAVAAAERCDDPPLAARVALVIERPGDPANALGPTCAEGPRDPALCDPACAALGRCLDGGNVLTDPDVCAFYCGTTAAYDDGQWRCAGEAAGCVGVIGCFAAP